MSEFEVRRRRLDLNHLIIFDQRVEFERRRDGGVQVADVEREFTELLLFCSLLALASLRESCDA